MTNDQRMVDVELLRRFQTRFLNLHCAMYGLQQGKPEDDELKGELNRVIDGPGVEPVAWVRFCSDGCYEGPIMHAAMEDVRKDSGAWTPLYLAAPSAPVQAVPAGWQWVPKEPTPEMLDAFCHGIGPTSNWGYMLAAAPQPPKEIGE